MEINTNDKNKSIMIYILKNYPKNKLDHLSTSRLTKIIYLADWYSAKETGKQLTGTKWYFDYYGPYVDDFVELAQRDSDMEVIVKNNIFGDKKRLVRLKKIDDDCLAEGIDEKDRKFIDDAINNTINKSYNDFIEFIYSTTPVRTSDRFSLMDLEETARLNKK